MFFLRVNETKTRMKNFMGSIFTISMLLLAFNFQILILAGREDLQFQKKGNCSYVVTIGTTCTKDAGTSSHVSLRFGDQNQNDILVRRLNAKHVKWVDPLGPQVLDDVARKPFQACTVDEFQVDAHCVDSPVCYLYLKLMGSDDWRPGFAQVRVLDRSHMNSGYFYFRRYLPRHVWHGFDACDGEVTPFGIMHKRKVFEYKLAV
ncbi:hypothetical protein Nepgr_000050 [Nepenthes gracilis]|uniref:Uncharacterized protein n=1 Tax=Nepenthes gracilis TaxID=150966 RepID=A0AAD3P2L3_NEPGR|nr:hypothetical protein Nepgr_000050 [Nepenthes gracilis]